MGPLISSLFHLLCVARIQWRHCSPAARRRQMYTSTAMEVNSEKSPACSHQCRDSLQLASGSPDHRHIRCKQRPLWPYQVVALGVYYQRKKVDI